MKDDPPPSKPFPASRFASIEINDGCVESALWTLTQFERLKVDAAAIRANEKLMKAVRQCAKRHVAEKNAEDRMLQALAK